MCCLKQSHIINVINTYTSTTAFTSLILESRIPCASSNIVLCEEINLPPFIHQLVSSTDLNAESWAYVIFKCSLTAAIT